MWSIHIYVCCSYSKHHYVSDGIATARYGICRGNRDIRGREGLHAAEDLTKAQLLFQLVSYFAFSGRHKIQIQGLG